LKRSVELQKDEPFYEKKKLNTNLLLIGDSSCNTRPKAGLVQSGGGIIHEEYDGGGELGSIIENFYQRYLISLINLPIDIRRKPGIGMTTCGGVFRISLITAGTFGMTGTGEID